MDFKSESVKTISERVLSDLKEAVGDPRYFMGASPLKAIAYAMGGVAYMLHAHIDHVAKYQIMPDTAKGEDLERWGRILGIERHKGSKALGKLDIKQNPIKDTSTLVSQSGKIYTINKLQYPMFHCEANEIGTASNLIPGPQLLKTLDDGTNIQVDAVEHGINGGSDPESEEDFREKILFRLKNPARGGTRSDFVFWCKELPFVNRVWIGRGIVSGNARFNQNISVYFTTHFDDHPIPNPEHIQLLENHLSSRAPILLGVSVYGPAIKYVSLKLSTKSIAKRQIVERALKGTILKYGEPNKTLTHSRLLQTVAQAIDGEEFQLLEPIQDTSFRNGEIGLLDKVEWV